MANPIQPLIGIDDSMLICRTSTLSLKPRYCNHHVMF